EPFDWDERSARMSKFCPDFAKENRSMYLPIRQRPGGRNMSEHEHHFANKIVKAFLDSNLSLILILLATILGFAALWLTPREEDPQIVVPLADIYVNFPGHSAGEVEQLVATPMEKVLYQIDGVEFVYSMSLES